MISSIPNRLIGDITVHAETSVLWDLSLFLTPGLKHGLEPEQVPNCKGGQERCQKSYEGIYGEVLFFPVLDSSSNIAHWNI